MSKYVFSTLTNDYAYTFYGPSAAPGQPRPIKNQIIIKGGANRANERLITPKGVMTVISDEQYEQLQTSKRFEKHVKNGFITVAGTRSDPDDVARKHMTPRDNSAPLTPTSKIFKDTGIKETGAESKNAGRVISAIRGVFR